MSLLITNGLGSMGDGTQSALVSTQGLGSTGSQIYPVCLAFQLFDLISAYKSLTLVLSNDFTVSGPAADPSRYIITPLDGGKPATVTAVAVVANRLVLTTTEHQNGKLYQLTVPELGLVDVNHNPFQGPFDNDYTGQGIAPSVVMSRSLDARTLEVVFSEPVTDASASNPANYSVTGGITVSAAVKVTDSVYRLTTSRQTRDVLYTVTATNILDLANNPD